MQLMFCHVLAKLCTRSQYKSRSDLRVGKVGAGLNWAVGKLQICLRISHKATVGEVGVCKVGVGEMGVNPTHHQS